MWQLETSLLVNEYELKFVIRELGLRAKSGYFNTILAQKEGWVQLED